MDEKTRRLIYKAVDQTISEDEFESLQDILEQDDRARAHYLRVVRVTQDLEELSSTPEDFDQVALRESAGQFPSLGPNLGLFKFGRLALAASLLLVVAGAAYWIGRGGRNEVRQSASEGMDGNLDPSFGGDDELRMAGHATLRRAVDLRWPSGASRHLEGEVIREGVLEFSSGVAELDFFSGATLVVEGPAKLDIESDWSVRVLSGRLRANVPNAARGFIVKAADSDIIDLGTEFAVEVGASLAQVDVIDGEVELRGGPLDGKHLLTGDSEVLRGEASGHESLAASLSTVTELEQRKQKANLKSLEQWKTFSGRFDSDPRMIAHYPIPAEQEGRVVVNRSLSGEERAGLIVGPVSSKRGRFGVRSRGLEFARPGARVRTRIDGEFRAFTFATWVRIDNLSHRYNALFMADGYENGEPHWQIRDDGRMMMSVMVDETEDVRFYNKVDQKVVRDAGRHRVYLSPPFWDLSKAGQWFHLVAVYDPQLRQVRQYVNGEEVCNDEIVDEYYIESLRIGPAEIGNWGQPFRKTPWFAVRNLSGTVDELSIWNAALSASEIRELYEQGKPVGY